VVPVDKKELFKIQAQGLLISPDLEDFQQRCDILIDQFPNCTPWLTWWIAPSHAQMVFPAYQNNKIEPELVLLVPETSNPIEALHQKTYLSVGNGYAVFVGLKLYITYVMHFERIMYTLWSM
jgi:hypothetical protein